MLQGLTAGIFLAGIVLLGARRAAGEGSSQVALGVLPLALLSLPAQVLSDLWQLVAAFKAVSAGQAGSGAHALFVLCLQHQRAWAWAAWLTVGALALAGVLQGIVFRDDAAPPASSPSAARPAWTSFIQVVSAFMIGPVGIVTLWAQRIEAQIMFFLGARSGIQLPASFPLVATLDPQQLGANIATDAVLVILTASVLIATLLALAIANVFAGRGPASVRGFAVFSWVALLTIGSAASAIALRLENVVRWGDQALPHVR